MKESVLILSAFENPLRAGLVQHIVHTNPTVEQNKNVNRFESPWIEVIVRDCHRKWSTVRLLQFLYTVNHKKRGILFLTITKTFRGLFYIFCSK